MKYKHKNGTVQKISNNSICPCGSGMKFKHCCKPQLMAEEEARRSKKVENKKITEELGLNNEFRKEVAKAEKTPLELENAEVGCAGMILRDQYVAMRHLQMNRDVLEEDRHYNEKMALVYKDFIAELEELPLSEARDSVIGAMTKQAELLQKGVKQSRLNTASVAMLDALERLHDMYNSAAGQAEPTAPQEAETTEEATPDPVPYDDPEDEEDDEVAEELKDDEVIEDAVVVPPEEPSTNQA